MIAQTNLIREREVGWSKGCLGLVVSISVILAVISTAWSAEYGEGEVYLSKGVLAYNKKEFNQALTALQEAIKAQPQNAEAHYYLGLTQIELGQYPEALASLQRSLQLDPKRTTIHFDLGITSFKMGKYAQALQEFRTAEQYQPERALVYYYQGYIHYLAKEYEPVPPLFTKARELDKALAQTAYLFSGLAYSQLNRLEEAEKEFQGCIKIDPGSELGLGAKKYLEDIQQRKKLAKRWRIFASMSPQYDDNVILQPGDTSVVQEVTQQGNTKGVFSLGGEYRLWERPNWSLNTRYALYQSIHSSLEDFDLQDHVLSLYSSYQGKYKEKTYYWFLSYDYSNDLLENNRYLDSNSLNNIFSFMYRPNLVTQLQYRLQHKDFHSTTISTPFNRDAYNHLIGLQQYIFFAENTRYLKLGYAYDNDLARGENWDYQGNKASISFYTPLGFIWKRLFLTLDFDYYRQDFLHTDTALRKTRRDKEYSAAVSIGITLSKGYTLLVKYMNITHDSNLALYDYDRELVFATLNLAY